MKHGWKEFRYRLEYLGLALLAGLIPRLPRRACVWLGKTAGALAYRLDARGRAVALANLEAAFGQHYSDPERRAIARASYQIFVRTMIDLFWAPRLTRENIGRWAVVEGEEETLGKLEKGGPGAMVVSAHFGNFEWGHLAIAFRGYQGALIAEDFKNARITPLFQKLRAQAGNVMLAQKFALVRILKNIKRGSTSGVLVDLTVSPKQPGAIVEAFGLKMRVTLLHALMAHRAGAPIMPYLAFPKDDGTCVVRLLPRIPVEEGATPEATAQRCWNAFEPHIREHPHLWLWAYKHWRFRPRAGGEKYPFYANPSTAFEKELATVKKNPA